MEKRTFEPDEIYLPITGKQFEDLTNEILVAMNELAAPDMVGPDYFAGVLMSDIHSRDHKLGRIKKSELFEGCVNRISCQATYHIVEANQARLKAQAEAAKVADADNVTPITSAPDAEVV